MNIHELDNESQRKLNKYLKDNELKPKDKTVADIIIDYSEGQVETVMGKSCQDSRILKFTNKEYDEKDEQSVEEIKKLISDYGLEIDSKEVSK